MYIIFVVCQQLSAYIIEKSSMRDSTYSPWCLRSVCLVSPLFRGRGLGFVVGAEGRPGGVCAMRWPGSEADGD